MKSASPIPTGAMNVPACFSAASMKMVKTNCAVRIISMKNPCAIVVVALNVVLTFNPPENRTLTRAAATIPPRTWTITRSAARKMVIEPISHIPKVTCSSCNHQPPPLYLGSQNTHSRIKQPPTNPKKHPRIHRQRKPKAQTDIQQLRRIILRHRRHDRRPGIRVGRDVGDLGAGKGEEEEEDGAGELAKGGDDVAAGGGRGFAEDGVDPVFVGFGVRGVDG
jgi:hypothetical protein